MKIDTERVIIEVQSRPLLWDNKNRLYKVRGARDRAWQDIARELIDDFDSLSDGEKKSIDKKIQQRWRTARDTYKKDKAEEKNTGSSPGIKGKKKYAYYEMLMFLDAPNIKSEVMEDSLFEIRDGSEDPNAQEDYATSSQVYEPIPPPPKRNKRYQASKFENQLLDCLKNNQLKLESDDLVFFYSLQPTLKKFTNYQKMQFRTKVLQAVMEVDQPKAQSPNNEDMSSSSPRSSHSMYEIPILSDDRSIDDSAQYNVTSTAAFGSSNSAPFDDNTRTDRNLLVHVEVESNVPASTAQADSDDNDSAED